MIAAIMKSLVQRRDLNAESAESMMEAMLDGQLQPEEIAGLLTALTMKGESVTEITACAKVLRRRSVRINLDTDVMDIVGTGGDGVGTFNISTTAAFVAAAAGVPIAKHGNRAASSHSGAADLLEQLGARLDLTPEETRRQFQRSGLCFLYAPLCHRMSNHIAQTRRSLGIRTLFNLLGPLANPAGATREIMGVCDRTLLAPMADVLANLGVTRGLTLTGSDGLDEATVTGPTFFREINHGVFRDFVVTPEEVGLARSSLESLRGGSPEENGVMTRRILSGVERGAKRDVVLLNAGLAIWLADRVKTLREGIAVAAEAIDSGRANKTLGRFLEGMPHG